LYNYFSDRLRTTVNVWGDSIGAGIVDHLSRDEIKQLEEEQNRHAHDQILTSDADIVEVKVK
jgi:hypothetical protein